MNQKTEAQLLERVPYFKIEFGGCIPTTDQLDAKVSKLNKEIFMAKIVAIVFSIVMAGIAYVIAWDDPGADATYMAFNPLCLIAVGVGLLILVGAKLLTDRLKTLRSVFMPSGAKMISFDPAVQCYLDAVIERGRRYLTNYEAFNLFPHFDHGG